MPKKSPLPADALTLARRMRREPTDAERKMWFLLRRERLAGFKFRRQHPIGPYILDFYCPELKLAIEIDGIAHDMGDRPERDEKRAAWLTDQGLRIIRIPAADVLKDATAVAESIRLFCSERR